MRGELVALAVIVGLGTWAFRYAPVWLRSSQLAQRRADRRRGGAAVGEGRGGGGERPAAALPLVDTDQAAAGPPPPRGLVGRFLAGIGVAAVAALAASSLQPYLSEVLSAPALGSQVGAGPESNGGLASASSSGWRTAVPLVTGLGATVLAFLPRKSVAAATLLGAAAYGLTSWLVGAAA